MPQHNAPHNKTSQDNAPHNAQIPPAARALPRTSAHPVLRLAGLALPVLIIAYFAYHTHQARLQLRALHDERARIEDRLAKVTARKQAIEDKVRLLRPESLDPDMLDERARAHLHLAGPRDLVIFRKSPAKPRN